MAAIGVPWLVRQVINRSAQVTEVEIAGLSWVETTTNLGGSKTQTLQLDGSLQQRRNPLDQTHVTMASSLRLGGDLGGDLGGGKESGLAGSSSGGLNGLGGGLGRGGASSNGAGSWREGPPPSVVTESTYLAHNIKQTIERRVLARAEAPAAEGEEGDAYHVRNSMTLADGTRLVANAYFDRIPDGEDV